MYEALRQQDKSRSDVRWRNQFWDAHTPRAEFIDAGCISATALSLCGSFNGYLP